MSEILKRKKGQVLSTNERQLILNLMNYLKEKNSGRSVSEVIREISKATGCSERTIYKIKKEANKGIVAKSNQIRLRKKENKNSRNVKYDSFVKSSIRKKIYNHFLQNITPTLNTILLLVNKDPDLPNFKRSTLHTLLKEIGFIYEQKGKKSLLSEKKDIIKYRQQYLRDIRKFRSENRWIIYTGETLISLIKKEITKDPVSNESEQNLIKVSEEKEENLTVACGSVSTVFLNTTELMPGTALVYTIESTTLGNPGNVEVAEEISIQNDSPNTDNIPIYKITTSNCLGVEETSHLVSRGEVNIHMNSEAKETSKKTALERELRLTIIHAGGSEGFIQDVDLVTQAKKKTEKNDSYEHWFIEKLLPKIPPNSVIVTDNNIHNNQKDDTFPDISWKKQQIKNWLLAKNVNFGSINGKKELLMVVNEVKPLHSTRYKLNELAKQKGIVIVNLPPFHYELNPLNMVWPHIKYYVKSNMKSFKMKKIKQLIKEAFYSVNQVSWMNYLHHVRQTEDLLWAFDELQSKNLRLTLSSKSNEC